MCVCVCVCVCVCSVVSDSATPWTVAHQAPLPSRFLCPWSFQGKNTGVGCYFLLQGIFLITGLKSNHAKLHDEEEQE